MFRARPEDLFRAWTDPADLRRWFQPLGLEAERLELDAGPGGGFELEFALAEGRRLLLNGKYRALEAQRIVFELRPRQRRSDEGSPSLVTVELVPRAGATTLVLRHEGLLPEDRANAQLSWQHCFGRLAGLLEEAVGAFHARLEEYPRFRSRFGGLWPDLSDARARIAGKQAIGQLEAEDARLFAHWLEKGFVLLPQAVPEAATDRLRAEMDEAWRRGDPRKWLEVYEHDVRSTVPLAPRFRDLPHKALDVHGHSHSAREIQFAPKIQRFLSQLFERPPLAFQSLLFRWGTEQDMHQDTAYVVLRSPLEFVGCWVALEDIVPGSGELQYYVGSHRIPEYLWLGRARAKPYGFDDDREFLRWVCVESERAGCPLTRFHPKRGDALIWHADLVHGGSKRTLPGVTRQSLVTHYCPVNVDPEWLDVLPNSGKLEHAPGSFYCFQQR
jgi:uncharacterized protein YndB with AHSA1/START domain